MTQYFNANKENAINVFFDKDVELFCFFQLLAPLIDSSQSAGLDSSKQKKIFRKMFARWNNYEFVNPQVRMNKKLDKYNIGSTDNVKCVGKRFVVKRSNYKEEDLRCFLRHIRNAIAHGRVFKKTVGGIEYILFDDARDGAFSARVICTVADLEKWKN